MVPRLGIAMLLLSYPLLAQQADRVDKLHAEAGVAEARGDFPAAIAKYREIIQLDPALAPAYNNLGALYFRRSQFRDAAEVLEKGLKLDPTMSSASALLGLSLSQMGEYPAARAPLEAALKARPADDNVEFALANDLTRLGDFEAAAQHLQQLSSRQPRDEHVLYLLGRVYMQLSEQALAKMNAINPDSVWAHEISAELMDSMKNYDGAIVEFKKALAIAPRQPGLHFKLGDLYWSLSQWDNATGEFIAEQAIDPKNCLVDYKLGDVLLQQSVAPERALAYVDKALSVCPNLAEARADRGRALLKLHRAGEAIADLQAAEKANGSDASTHFLLAQAYRAAGRSEEASAEMKLFSSLEQKTRNAAAERAGEVIQNNQTAH